MKFRFLPHTADVKVRAYGRTQAEAFANAAMALKTAICGDIAVAPRRARRIRVRGADAESMLCGFLEEFLYLLDAERFLPAAVDGVVINGASVNAKVSGDDADCYTFSNPVKAVTYIEMFARKRGGRWTVQFVLDV